jgi:hypothetical protein
VVPVRRKSGIWEGTLIKPTLLLTITRDVRIVRHIESVVSERPNCAHDLREHHPGPTSERLVAWRAEIVEILRFFGVRGCHSMVPTVPKPP